MPSVGDSIYPRHAGRLTIYTDVEEITPDNVVEVLKDSLETHLLNSADSDYLYNYYKGIQPVLQRVPKEKGTEDTLNKVVENHAHEIVSFATSYLLYEPIQYVNIDDTKESGLDLVNKFNRVMDSVDKAATDKIIADWMHICGQGYRFVFPSTDGLIVEALDPRATFVVYSSDIPHRPMMGVMVVERKKVNRTIYNVYTENTYYRIEHGSGLMENYVVTQIAPTYLHGEIPIIEYIPNMSRLGSFEIVIGLLDAINETASDRIDSVQNFVHSILAIIGARVEDEDEFWATVRRYRGITLPEGASAQYLAQELGQDGTQVLVDHMIEQVLKICGMPQRTGGSSTSDNGVAVILRDGFTDAESRAKSTELNFKKSERVFLRIATDILRTMGEMDVDPNDIGIQFGRRNYENIQSKAQVLTTMLGCDKIAPKLAFEHSGMFSDPALAYAESKQYMDEQEVKAQEELNQLTQMRTQSGLDGSEEAEADV